MGYLDENIDCLKQIYSERAERVSNSLLKNFNDDISFTHPQGGFYFWLQFPEAFDAEKFLPLAGLGDLRKNSQTYCDRICDFFRIEL